MKLIEFEDINVGTVLINPDNVSSIRTFLKSMALVTSHQKTKIYVTMMLANQCKIRYSKETSTICMSVIGCCVIHVTKTWVVFSKPVT